MVGRVAQGIGPEFKPPVPEKKKINITISGGDRKWWRF
jgi:hypothetical protein